MIVTLASVLFTAGGLVVAASIGSTLLRYGARTLALGNELGACREHFELRLVLQPVAVTRGPASVRPALPRTVSPRPEARFSRAGLRAAA